MDRQEAENPGGQVPEAMALFALMNEGDIDEDQIVQYVDVEFEGRVLTDLDFVGIRNLLQRENGLLRGQNIDATRLTNLLIGQNYVGSTIKQLFDPEDEDDGDDEDMNDAHVVYGITSVVNLKERQGDDGQVIKQIRQALVARAKESTDPKASSYVNELFANESTMPIGFLINERMFGIIENISAPLFRVLRTEMLSATKKGMEFKFERYVLFARVNIVNPIVGRDVLMWRNTEEESLAEAALHTFPFFTKDSDENGIIESYRCLIITADAFHNWIANIQPSPLIEN